MHDENDTDYVATAASTPLNRGKLWFLGCAGIMLVAGFWLCLQLSPNGITIAGQTGFTALAVIALFGGILTSASQYKIPGSFLGGVLGFLTVGMFLGVFLPRTLFQIPPDIFSTLVASLGALVSPANWGVYLTAIVLMILLGIVLTFFLGSALTKVSKALHSWLHT